MFKPDIIFQVTISLKWESKDANGKTLLCLESPLHIAS